MGRDLYRRRPTCSRGASCLYGEWARADATGQTFLAQKGCQYLEIQAGLAHTQLEHLPMDANASLSWLEAYGPINVDAARTHSDDWSAAQDEVEQAA